MMRWRRIWIQISVARCQLSVFGAAELPNPVTRLLFVMRKSFQQRLDTEASERLEPVREKFNRRTLIAPEEIFANSAVVKALGKSSILLGGPITPRIMMSIPFYNTVFVPICY